jgi:hypothetical protein
MRKKQTNNTTKQGCGLKIIKPKSRNNDGQKKNLEHSN